MKNYKKHWLRWGAIFFAVSIVVSIINLNCYGNGSGGLENLKCMFFYLPLVIPIFLFGPLFDSLQLNESTETYVAMAFGVILWTIIGMVLGWIYGKIKNKKTSW